MAAISFTARRWVVRTAILLLFATVIAVWLGLSGLSAQRHLQAARAALDTARQALLDGRPQEARAAVVRAGKDTARARALTDDPVWKATAALPYVGVTLKAVRAVVAGADDLSRVVLPGAVAAAESLSPQTLRRADGSFDLARIKAAAPEVHASALAAQGVRDRLGRPAGPVVGAVATAQRQLAAQVDQVVDLLGSADRTLKLAPALLGSDRARRYLVLVQQSAESRGTGGLIGGFAVIEAEAGQLRTVDQGSNADLENGAVAVPPGVPASYVDLYGGDGALELWQNVNLSPDLPTVARVVEALWQAQGGKPLDGVIALDSVALASILRGTSPLVVGDLTVAPDRLVEFLAVEQYRGVSGNRDRGVRKDLLSDFAVAAAATLSSPGSDTRALVRGLAEAVTSGHLRMTSRDSLLQPGLRAAEVDGALPGGAGPLAFPVVSNATGGKLDYFLDRSVVYLAGPCQGVRRPSSISVRLTNQAPAEGLPPYMTVRNVDGVSTESTDSGVVLRVYGTPGSRLIRATLDGRPLTMDAVGSAPYLSYGVEAGIPQWFLTLDLPRGKPRQLVLQLAEPTVPGQARIPVQPLSRPLGVRVAVPAC
ncbi:DUF4012 domain-containing protein [Aeromicrobium sp.]|uniref:DUF4012 domain-containing protein n=1 Tax=Aeromicrobium sp. TaxID=1871063 RepID=UPI0019A25BDF|nr:DUF4012 domain-containing protein [Aeromicrobium sp.]MBC7633536.1 DUF4012 domain-containing protein [Aeromicrobium sp.]